MSVIDKYPFINAVLTSLSDEDLASLQECVNGAGGSSVFKSILAGSSHLLKTTDKGVYPIELEVARAGSAQTVYPGFLIYNDDYCVVISFATDRNQILTVLDLHLVNGLWKYEIKPFELSITDLRSEMFDVAGGGSGGTVEAEPIVSIKMTNLEMKTTDSDLSDIRDAQIYCTKETWNSLVSLANTLGITLTYQNLGTLLQGSSAQEQGAFIGILLNDYYNGKVLPIPYLRNANNWCANLIEAVQTNLQSALGIDIDAVAAAVWGTNLDAKFPNILDRVEDGYVTADTVITVEEIEGPAIGSSSGSGTSDVLYKHTITGLIAEPDTPESDPEQVTLTFLSKHASSFASNSSLVDFGANLLNTDDANAVISPMIVGDSGGINVTVIPTLVSGSLHQINILFPYSTSGNFYYQITASRNATSITDTVEPYIQVSGGSGGSASDDRLPTPTSSDAGKEIYATEDGKYAFADVFHFTVADLESINVYFVNSPAFETQAITAMNTMIDSTNSQYGTSIPNISSFNDIYGLFSYLKSNNLTPIFKTFYATLFAYTSIIGVKVIYSVLLPVNGQVTLLNTSSVNGMLVVEDMVFWYQSYNATTEQLELHKSIPLTTDGLAEVDYNGNRTLLS